MLTVRLPDHTRTPLPVLRSQCRAIFDRRKAIVGHLPFDQAREAYRKAQAIVAYVGNREGRDDARRAALVLAQAVGAALGDKQGRGAGGKFTVSQASETAISNNDKYRCRLLYEHRSQLERELGKRGLSLSQALTLIQLRRQAQEALAASTGTATIARASYATWLAAQPDCDLLLTDPPYLTEFNDLRAFRAFVGDWIPRALSKVLPTGRAYVCIGAYPDELEAYLTAPRAGLTLAQVLVWTYRNAMGPTPAKDYKQNWQAVLYFRGAQAGPLNCPKKTKQFSVQDINAPDGRQGDRDHPWQKPDELAKRFIEHATKPGDLVLDPFAGIGTFLLVAARLGRHAAGCDVDPAQVKLCRRRGCRAA